MHSFVISNFGWVSFLNFLKIGCPFDHFLEKKWSKLISTILEVHYFKGQRKYWLNQLSGFQCTFDKYKKVRRILGRRFDYVFEKKKVWVYIYIYIYIHVTKKAFRTRWWKRWGISNNQPERHGFIVPTNKWITWGLNLLRMIHADYNNPRVFVLSQCQNYSWWDHRRD